MEETLDLRGLICPQPVLRTKQVLDNPNFSRVKAIVESEVNVNNLSRLAKSLKMKMHSQKQADCFIVTIERYSNQATDGETGQHAMHELPKSTFSDKETAKAETTGTVIFLGKDGFGDGDPDFSKTLTSLFLQTAFAADRPRAILMANSGVKLLAPDSPSLKVLEDFRRDGVEVLACGLCVDYYNLKDHISTEQITNMFSICEYIFAADKLIVP